MVSVACAKSAIVLDELASNEAIDFLLRMKMKLIPCEPRQTDLSAQRPETLYGVSVQIDDWIFKIGRQLELTPLDTANLKAWLKSENSSTCATLRSALGMAY